MSWIARKLGVATIKCAERPIMKAFLMRKASALEQQKLDALHWIMEDAATLK